jgi:hypothetical protein
MSSDHQCSCVRNKAAHAFAVMNCALCVDTSMLKQLRLQLPHWDEPGDTSTVEAQPINTSVMTYPDST